MADSLNGRMDKAQRAEAALKELEPVFDAVLAAYANRLTKIAASEPWEARKISNFAAAITIAETVKAHIQAIAKDGEMAQAEREHIRKIERMSPERRKVLGFVLPS